MSAPEVDYVQRIAGAMKASRVPHAFIGAAARNTWAPPRLTTDLDFVVDADKDAYDRILGEMARIRFHVDRAFRTSSHDVLPYLTIFKEAGPGSPYRQVDVMVAGTPFEAEAVQRRVWRPLLGLDVPVVTREDLLVYKLIAWRDRDRGDIQDVLRAARLAGIELDLDYVRRHALDWQVEDRLEDALARSAEDG